MISYQSLLLSTIVLNDIVYSTSKHRITSVNSNKGGQAYKNCRQVAVCVT